ncbi:MAG: acetate--CoA ligase family protein [Candidatus Kapabacteria bacterium]|jgi:acyl-CoA synthetase (NDP forming)|nr:acetate--CoA ligase family protein [Candidatus Kapabacteria bacterium]
MIVKELLEPKSIVIVGASNELSKPGGRVVKHIIDGNYDGDLYTVNPKESEIQGVKCFKSVAGLEKADLAILAIASKYCLDTIKELAYNKGTKAFIILSAGFSEIGEEGKKLEDEIVAVVNEVGGSLIGPNCVGVLTPSYKGSFTGPIPKLQPKGVDFVTGSGATAVFIMETAIPMGLSFASLYSVGNSAQMGVEEVLEYWDETFDAETSSTVKMIYIENVGQPKKLLKHAASLINKGCKICAIKSGTTDAGSRAVSSHTGALAGSVSAVDTLFRKAGIVRCYSKEELCYVAGVFSHKELTGKNIAVITHAGGPGVMLTDSLSKGNMEVPHLEGEAADELMTHLFHGSAVGNPIDFLATGTAEQLGTILDFVDEKFDNIDGSAVIFGTPGLFDVTEVYDLMNEKMKTLKKPVYPVLPSLIQAKDAVAKFLSYGRVNFPEEVNLGNALAKVYHTHKPAGEANLPEIDTKKIRSIIDNADNGYIPASDIQSLLDAAGINRAGEAVVDNKADAAKEAGGMGYPVVMKIVGPVHKSDVGGISLNVADKAAVEAEFERIMAIEGAKSVMLQPMLSGRELFVGAKYEEGYGHMILCGLGGIFIEVLKDVAYGLSPLGKDEAESMIRSIKAYDLIKGVRGQEGVDETKFGDIIVRLSALLEAAPEIKELDLNPLLGTMKHVTAVDARIRVEK